jgi:hypothetical protein
MITTLGPEFDFGGGGMKTLESILRFQQIQSMMKRKLYSVRRDEFIPISTRKPYPIDCAQ